jgi:hypothetical protein
MNYIGFEDVSITYTVTRFLLVHSFSPDIKAALGRKQIFTVRYRDVWLFFFSSMTRVDFCVT